MMVFYIFSFIFLETKILSPIHNFKDSHDYEHSKNSRRPPHVSLHSGDNRYYQSHSDFHRNSNVRDDYYGNRNQDNFEEFRHSSKININQQRFQREDYQLYKQRNPEEYNNVRNSQRNPEDYNNARNIHRNDNNEEYNEEYENDNLSQRNVQDPRIRRGYRNTEPKRPTMERPIQTDKRSHIERRKQRN